MAGVSLEGQAIATMFGAHAGLNIEVFYSSDPSGQYTVGLFGFETTSSVYLSGDPYTDPRVRRRDAELKWYQGLAGGFHTMGLAFGASVGVNVAIASDPRYNSPEGWCGFFDVLSASGPVYGGSIFWSDYVLGAEVSVGASPLPISGGFTRPKTHALWTGPVDKGTARALWRVYLQWVE